MRTERVAILIKKTALVIDEFANQILTPFDLTNTQYKVMKFLYAKVGGKGMHNFVFTDGVMSLAR